MTLNIWKYSAPQTFFPLAGKMVPVFAVLGVLFALPGLYIGFFVAPTDFQQGEAYDFIRKSPCLFLEV